MASFGHVAVGLLAGRLHGGRGARASELRCSWWTLAVFAGMAVLPDVDVLIVACGACDDGLIGHRGASHSLVMALGIGITLALLMRRLGWPVLRTAIAASFAVGSHGVLDALAQGGTRAACCSGRSPRRAFMPRGGSSRCSPRPRPDVAFGTDGGRFRVPRSFCPSPAWRSGLRSWPGGRRESHPRSPSSPAGQRSHTPPRPWPSRPARPMGTHRCAPPGSRSLAKRASSTRRHDGLTLKAQQPIVTP